jgi:simple sugar transport system ATP-binding protein
MATPRLTLDGVTKRFPAVLANDRVDLEVAPGEIHALLGENGAGKSTLVKIIYRVLRPDSGRILWEGREVGIDSPHAARRLGIGMVFQHFSLFEPMTVLENIALGIDDAPEPGELSRRIVEVSHTYGLPLDPAREVDRLSVGERQRIEIVRCLLQDPRLLIMDEPTSVLTPQEAERLFATLRRLAADGCSILFISHKLAEIRALCERATILRLGRVVAVCDPRRESARTMAQTMLGGELKSISRAVRGAPGAVRLEVEKLDLPAAGPFETALKDVGFTVRAGELFGIAGVAGNGQTELVEALSGERRSARADAIRLDGRPVGTLDAGARRSLGLNAVPEERNGHAAVPELTLTENAVLTGYRRWTRAGLLALDAARTFAADVIRTFDVRTGGTEASARSLSGGNLQKFVVGRELLQEPSTLIVSQPTWGVDAGAAATIHQALLDLAARGCAVVIVSQDLDELLALTDRLAVVNGGRLSRPMPTAEATAEQIGLLMGGLHDLADLPPAPGAVHAA